MGPWCTIVGSYLRLEGMIKNGLIEVKIEEIRIGMIKREGVRKQTAQNKGNGTRATNRWPARHKKKRTAPTTAHTKKWPFFLLLCVVVFPAATDH